MVVGPGTSHARAGACFIQAPQLGASARQGLSIEAFSGGSVGTVPVAGETPRPGVTPPSDPSPLREVFDATQCSTPASFSTHDSQA